MTGLIILGVLLVGVIAFSILAREHWHWSHIVLVNLTFVAGSVALLGLVKVSRDRIESHSAYLASVRQLQDAEEAYRVAVFGPDQSTMYTADSLRGINEALRLETMSMGRSWHNGQIETRGRNKLFRFASRRASTEGDTDLRGAVLYAFLDEMIEEMPYPGRFVGTMRVVSDTEEYLELQPVLVVSAELLDQPGTWTLFERMPVDDPRAFLRGRAEEMDITQFRQYLESEVFPAAALNMDAASREYERFIDSFAFDGRSITEIEDWILANQGTRKSMSFERSPNDVYVRYRFRSRSRNTYQVDGTGVLSVDGPFTPTGQAIDPALHLGAPVQFEVDDVVTVSTSVANGYQRPDGTPIQRFDQMEDVEQVAEVYRRPLFEFPEMIHELRQSTASLAEQTERVREEIQILDKANADATDQLDRRQDIIAKLREDNTNLDRDLQAMTEYARQKGAELEELKTRVEYLTNQIDQKQKQLSGRSGL